MVDPGISRWLVGKKFRAGQEEKANKDTLLIPASFMHWNAQVAGRRRCASHRRRRNKNIRKFDKLLKDSSSSKMQFDEDAWANRTKVIIDNWRDIATYERRLVHRYHRANAKFAKQRAFEKLANFFKTPLPGTKNVLCIFGDGGTLSHGWSRIPARSGKQKIIYTVLTSFNLSSAPASTKPNY